MRDGDALDPATSALPGAARAVLREVLVHGPLERAEVGRRLALSPASLTRLSRPLLDAGLLVEQAGVTRAGAGRPARPLDVRPDARTFVGVKITAHDATAVLTDLRAGVLADARTDLPDRTVDGVVARVAALVREVANDAGDTGDTGDAGDAGGRALAGVGVTVGGRVQDRRVAADAMFLGWTDVPLAAHLEAALGVPVRVENDVVALLVAEQWFGEVRGTGTFALVTIGAGIGYGLVAHGRPVTGPDTVLSPVAHGPLDPAGPPCALGHPGCATALLTTGEVGARVARAHGRPGVVGWAEVLEGARAGDPACAAEVDAAARGLGRLLAWVASTTGAEAVVVSGEGTGLLDVAGARVRAALDADRPPTATPVRLVVEAPDFVMWARGAAAVAIQDVLVGTP